MKISPREREQAILFGPSKFSAEGFLGDDRRSVEEIIEDDRQKCENLGTTSVYLAKCLAKAFQKAESAMGDPVELGPGISATLFEARGKIPSPFRGDGVFQKGEVMIYEEEKKTTLFITRLGIHMIKKHGFFQGRGSRYRIEPADVLRLCSQPVSA
ncbi:MAG: hypothetical protein JW863_02355 [Chitinispirillaceae bacterium]|nr:hypothetical protein [Chitinispirillaceae bacterium]